MNAGLDQAIARGLAYAPYADLIWCETGTPDLHEAKAFAEAIHKKFPDKMLAYNCSPSFNWKKKLDDATIAKFQRELGAMGYKFQFITLAGFHALNYSMFQLARGYKASQMAAYVQLQEQEFAAEKDGYTATKHQREVGAGYFDDVTQTVTAGQSSVTAMKGSTEEAQFHKAHAVARGGVNCAGDSATLAVRRRHFRSHLHGLPAPRALSRRKGARNIPTITAHRSRRSAIRKARLIIVGLAPGFHGANASGRPFTGDHAGLLLYRTLHRFGFASRPESTSRDDGLKLLDCRITNSVKCVPPENKPTPAEIRTCNRYLTAELNRRPAAPVLLALGSIAHNAALRALALKPVRLQVRARCRARAADGPAPAELLPLQPLQHADRVA